MEEFTTEMGQTLDRVHDIGTCSGEFCCIHQPSSHPLMNAPRNWRWDRMLMERMCEHGIGHPDPDHIAHVRHVRGDASATTASIHGCDGCCRTKEK